jgi:hypothetical protein
MAGLIEVEKVFLCFGLYILYLKCVHIKNLNAIDELELLDL